MNFGWVWHYGAPALLVVGSLAMLVAAVRSKPGAPAVSRADWPLLLLLVMWTGDAAVGENRPPLERAWKGAVAALLWTTVAITWWRRRRAGRATESPPAPR